MKAIVAILFLTISTVSYAQVPDSPGAVNKVVNRDVRPMTLQEVEAAALAGNLDFRASASRVRVAETRISGAGALDDPRFMYRGWGIPFRQPWNYNQAENMFMLSQSFAGAGKRGLRSSIAGQEVEIAKALLEVNKREVQLQARAAFYQLLRTYDELRLYEQEAALARQAIDSARIKYTVGRVPQQDVLKAQTALTKLVARQIEFEMAAELARAQLNALLGRDADKPLEVQGTYVPPTKLPTLSELKRTAVENRPELAALRSSIQQREFQSRLAGKAYTPDLTVSAGYMLMPAGSPFRNNYMAELTVDLPWLNRRKHDSAIASAKAETSLQRAELERAQVTVFLEVQMALIKARAASRAVELYRDTLRPQAQATFKSALAAYETDRADFLNLLDSQSTALEVEYSYFRSLTEFEMRVAELERAVGAPIERPAPGAGVQQ